MSALDAAAFHSIGRPLLRVEDERLLRGVGRFTDDARAPGQAYAAFARSPHAHARILRIDAAGALAMPGVLAVLTGEDARADALGPIPHDPVPKTKFDMKLSGPGGSPVFIGPHAPLPADKARHVGEAVAMVVARTQAQALDALENVAIDYEILPWVGDQADALSADAPAVWDEAADNVLVDTSFGDPVATERAFEQAAHVARAEFHIPRVTAAAIEPRSALGEWDPEAKRFTLHCGGGGAVRQKHELAAVLGVAPQDVRVLTFDVGGNFGSKNRTYVEYALVLWAARKIGRPVKWTATRSEAFLTDYQGRDLLVRIALAMTRDGRFLALRSDNISNVGSHCASLSPLGKGSGLITGSYAIPAATLRARAVFTNTMPTQAYRSSGRPEVNYALERLIDLAALEFGFDRMDLRRRNLVRPAHMPYRNAIGAVYDSGDYPAAMERVLLLADWPGAESRRREAATRGRLHGFGFANYVESSIGTPRERVEITLRPEGRVRVLIGTQPSGQGHETSFAQVVADLCGVPADSVEVVLGDTDVIRIGGGSHSGRSMRHAGTVIAKASVELIEKGKRLAAHLLSVAPDAIAFTDGRFTSAASNRSFTPLELAAEAARVALPAELRDGLSVGVTHEMHEPVFPNGAAACEVEIDPQTGALAVTRYASVDDVGRCINPLIVHGQTHGGIAQGVGEALCERIALGSEGEVISGSLMDYALPRADDLPSFATEIAEVLSPTNPLGIKAGGEGGTTPALSVITSAVADALRDCGVRNVSLPTTPFQIWRALRDAKDSRP